ncbi:MAG: hypothetical protein WC824_10770, partial [Bacteroidota bacterium]
MDERLHKAREFAIKAHGDQKYGDQPYVVHLDAVKDLVLGYNCDNLRRATDGAFLHDILEDCPDYRY